MRAKTSKAPSTAAVATILLVALLQTGCSSSPTPPAAERGGSLAAARSDLGPVPRLSARSFREFDKNGDGFLTPDEAEGPLALYFDDLDKNKDGKLSPQELGMREYE